MDIRNWRIDAKVSQRELAVQLGILGANPARTLQRYECGESQMPAPMVDRLTTLSSGKVSAQDMHETRIEWLSVNRPSELISIPSDEASA
ncbi:helix-turn-helix domain-containing protein [Maritalea sp.]|jgi:transcriptional regulator with XRE-family HTH domain|uniref:helix-turn-helix domain-containing protein n=1 Tax=Maritalea sp. TaxID=2003361 RepID=UPI0039E50803